jgi:hypothetical protein
MIKRNVVKLAIAGLLAGAAVAHAESSPFPLAAENGPFQRYMDGVTIESKTGTVGTVYPRAEIQTYVATGDAAKKAIATLGMQSAFPAMAETGPRI